MTRTGPRFSARTGASIDTSRFLARPGQRRVQLPAYPFERQRYWIDPPSSSAPAKAAGKKSDIDIFEDNPLSYNFPAGKTPHDYFATVTKKNVPNIKLIDPKVQVQSENLGKTDERQVLGLSIDAAKAQYREAQTQAALAEQEAERAAKLRAAGILAVADAEKAQADYVCSATDAQVCAGQMQAAAIAAGYAGIDVKWSEGTYKWGTNDDATYGRRITLATSVTPMRLTSPDGCSQMLMFTEPLMNATRLPQADGWASMPVPKVRRRGTEVMRRSGVIRWSCQRENGWVPDQKRRTPCAAAASSTKRTLWVRSVATSSTVRQTPVLIST